MNLNSCVGCISLWQLCMKHEGAGKIGVATEVRWDPFGGPIGRKPTMGQCSANPLIADNDVLELANASNLLKN